MTILILLCFPVQVVWMREEYNSILSTPTDADKIGCLAGSDTSVKPKYQPDISAADISSLNCSLSQSAEELCG